MSIERTSRTISVACVASAGVHALLYLALSTYGQRPVESVGAAAEVPLVLSLAESLPRPEIDLTPKPEPVPSEPPKPELKPREPPPPPPPPPDEPERVRLGNQNAPETETKTWLGGDKPDESQARKASVEQGAFTQSPGLPGNPSDTMGPESASAAPLSSPSNAQADTSMPPSEPPSEASPAPRVSAAPAAASPPEASAPPSESAGTAAASVAPTPEDPTASGRSAPSAPAGSPPPLLDPDGVRPTEPAVPTPSMSNDLAARLAPPDSIGPREIDLDDLFPPAALTPSASKPEEPPMTRDRAIALVREAFAFPQFPRSARPPADASPATSDARSNAQPPGGGSTGDRPFEKSDKDVDPSSLDDPIEVRPGRPLAAKGLEIKTVPLDLTTLSRRFTWTTNPVVIVKFGRDGTVIHADFVRGQTAGSPEWNNALLSAMYRWRAAGEELKKLPRNNPEAGVEVQFRILLRD